MKIEVLQRNEVVDELYPFIRLLSNRTGHNFVELLQEVLRSLYDPLYITFIERLDSGGLRFYFCGHFKSKEEFFLTQAYRCSPGQGDQELGVEVFRFIESYLVKQVPTIKRIVAWSQPSPKVFERYGFKVIKYVMEKEVKDV